MKRRLLYIKIIINLQVAAVTFVVILFLIPKLLGFFMPFVIGWIIALVANPFVKLLEDKVNMKRKCSSALLITVVLLVVIGGLYYFCYAIIGQITRFVNDFPDIYVSIEASVHEMVMQWENNVKSLPDGIKNLLEQFTANTGTYLMEKVQTISLPNLEQAPNIVGFIANSMFLTIITITSSFFFLADKEEICVRMKQILPETVVCQYGFIAESFKQAMGNYLKAQLKLMVLVMAILAIGFFFMGYSYGLLMAIGISFIDFLPVFGIGAVIWPWVVFDLFAGNIQEVIYLLILYLICQITKQVLEPKMVGDSMGISPLASLFLIFIGYQIKGVLGMILALPIGMVVIRLYESGLFDSLIDGIKILINDFNEFRRN